ncbi:DNA mismatch repair protein MutS [Wenyingzhuangia fucanilytica]|uniref:DNA mismatch repair protein MutS n=1 Tax=Wenyingzhuangia fucanilytica TaxID=1790137 RepID=A0A1B1Y4C6_9FLAO|nr:DNA mismatch repair protein MutS [Wenyingzhuangia fucanilytica]ANW95625.1 DNA mismatch repair protein MutS [Wenyingzhuangia fucanilytica]
MSQIHSKTLQDLEFSIILESISKHCTSEKGKELILDIVPFANKPDLEIALAQVNEYLGSLVSENRIPNHYFDDIDKDVKLLKIENSKLLPEAFLKIANISNTSNEIIVHFQKFKDYYPTLSLLTEDVEFTKNIVDAIFKIITNYGEVQSKASELLNQIRKKLNDVRSQISSSFNNELAKYNKAGYLDDIRESIIENQPVLAVQSIHRKKVKGSILGTSKTGSIVFIAPQNTLNLYRQLQELLLEEKQEVDRILRILTDQIRPFAPLIEDYIVLLTALDVLKAKAFYAKEIEGVKPEFSKNQEINYINAYHPILLEKNKSKNLPVVPQTLLLGEKQQIIVISGPNAGGKSITLKTIGLLQVMIQSGILIPVHENSTTHFFDHILTDIGDNQSIENQLSTYSYRLKNMRGFLKKCTNNTLFLIDEFGTGSDPELGGALAEIFLEEFYNVGAYGVITTHYTNLKVLADELENVVNANMAFDSRTLEPLFTLLIGQPGSSFTFEVAQKNGIPFSLINRAKKKIDKSKVRFDKTISKLQQERTNLQRNTLDMEQQSSKAKEYADVLAEKENKIQEKLESFQTLYDTNQKILSIGRKINELLNKYFQTNNKKEFKSELDKWVIIEKSKYDIAHPKIKKSKPQKVKEKIAKKKAESILKKTEEEVLTKVIEVRKEKIKEEKIAAEKKASYVFKLNDKVRLIDGRACGIIEKIDKKKVTINYGMFTTATTLDKIELVVAAKRKK